MVSKRRNRYYAGVVEAVIGIARGLLYVLRAERRNIRAACCCPFLNGRECGEICICKELANACVPSSLQLSHMRLHVPPMVSLNPSCSTESISLHIHVFGKFIVGEVCASDTIAKSCWIGEVGLRKCSASTTREPLCSSILSDFTLSHRIYQIVKIVKTLSISVLASEGLCCCHVQKTMSARVDNTRSPRNPYTCPSSAGHTGLSSRKKKKVRYFSEVEQRSRCLLRITASGSWQLASWDTSVSIFILWVVKILTWH